MAEDFERQLEAMEQLEALRHSAAQSAQQRAENGPPKLKAVRTAYLQSLGSLKSDLKKCTTFVKKIRTITQEGLAQCVRDIEVLNMSLYIEEIVAAIVESNFKSTDVPLLVKLCVQLHQRYQDFTEPLVCGLRAALLEDGDEGGKRRRIQLRFLIELFQAGVFRDEEFFLQLLRHLLGKAAGGRAAGGQPKRSGVDVAGLVTFVKYAAEPLLGHVSKKTLELVAAAGSAADGLHTLGVQPCIITAGTSRDLNQLVREAADNMSNDLVKAFAEFKRCEKKSEKDAVIHGSLTEQKQQELTDLRKLYEKLLSAVTSICECLDLGMPLLKEEKESSEGGGSGGLSVWDSSSMSVDYGPFGDAESKQFYDDLPDLLVMVPLTALGLTSEQAVAMREEWQKKRDSAFLQGENEEQALPSEVEGDDKEGPAEDLGGEEVPEEAAAGGDDAGTEGLSGTSALRLNVLLTEKLPECNTRQKADDFSSSFCYVSSKKARKSLVTHLSRIPKGRTELIPNYARIVSSLARLYTDIAPPILSNLYGCFIGKYKSKYQFDFDGKARNIRYIGELIKFSVAPPIMAFNIFTKLFMDFVNQNVLLCAILLETCGRFLYLLPYTHDRIEAILDTVLRLRRAKNLDSNCQMALEAAYFTVKPPERKELRKKKELSRLQQYVRFLFSSKLSTSPGAVDKVIKELRKLPWTNKEEKVEHHVIKACLRVVRTKFVDIPLAADTVAGLSRYHPKLLVSLLDTISEEFYRGMDSPRKREPQKLLGLARFLGECYNYSMINSTTIFDFLYLFLHYGHEVTAAPSGVSTAHMPKLIGDVVRQFQDAYDVTNLSELDSPVDLFRAQLVVEVLRACGSYFVRGILKDRLSRFLLHFQRYLLCKAVIPMHIEFTILELFDELEALAADRLEPGEEAEEEGEECEEETADLAGENEDNDAELSEANAAQLMTKLRLQEEEDDEFERAFRSAMLESVSSAQRGDAMAGAGVSAGAGPGGLRVGGVDRMSLPAVLPKPKNVFKPRSAAGYDDCDSDDDDDEGAEEISVPKVKFKLLSRDQKGRYETREFTVSKDATMVTRLEKLSEQQRLEKQKLKETVLR
ncbi:unnamed protein product, partial [Ectocarpus fasciculatus]